MLIDELLCKRPVFILQEIVFSSLGGAFFFVISATSAQIIRFAKDRYVYCIFTLTSCTALLVHLFQFQTKLPSKGNLRLNFSLFPVILAKNTRV